MVHLQSRIEQLQLEKERSHVESVMYSKNDNGGDDDDDSYKSRFNKLWRSITKEHFILRRSEIWQVATFPTHEMA